MITALFYPIKLAKSYRQSIAYIPSLLALGYFLVGLAAVVPEDGLFPLPVELEFAHFTDTETRRTLLSTLITGMVSLMVFSFSMVMSVLSQAGGNFSHKLVFGLVTKRHHQWVLGHYLGTILYVLMLLMMPGSEDSPGLWRSLHAYLAAVMVMHCLALFVYFIHKASQSVQVNSVAASLHQATSHALHHLQARQQAARYTHLPQPRPFPSGTRSSHRTRRARSSEPTSKSWRNWPATRMPSSISTSPLATSCWRATPCCMSKHPTSWTTPGPRKCSRRSSTAKPSRSATRMCTG